jgi:hypothetical protein
MTGIDAFILLVVMPILFFVCLFNTFPNAKQSFQSHSKDIPSSLTPFQKEYNRFKTEALKELIEIDRIILGDFFHEIYPNEPRRESLSSASIRRRFEALEYRSPDYPYVPPGPKEKSSVAYASLLYKRNHNKKLCKCSACRGDRMYPKSRRTLYTGAK